LGSPSARQFGDVPEVMKRWLFAMIAIATASTRAAEAGKDTPTVMSPYEVRAESVAFHGWIKRISPHFIVYTDGSSSEASTALREFEMLREAGQGAFRRVAARYSPTIIILPTGGSDWRKLETKGGSVEWKTSSVRVGGTVVPILVAQYDWEAGGLSLMRLLYADVERREMDLEGPFWLERGFGLFYETVGYDGDRVDLGRGNQRVFYLQDHAWIPWDRFFQVRGDSPEFVKERLVNAYEAQAALFTQFLFSNPDRIWMTRLVAWLDYLRSGARPTEEEFKAIFGQDWKQWKETMQHYLAGGQYSMLQLRISPAAMHFTEGKPELPVREIRDLFILTQILVQHTAESEASLDALLVTGLSSPNLREMLIEACLDWKKPDPALRTVRQLIAEGSMNAHVYYVGDELLNSQHGNFGLNARHGPETAELRAWDQRGLALEPLDCDLNNACAENEAAALIVDQQSIATIEECYRRIKGRAPTDEVIAALAMALWRVGETTTAAELATKLAGDPLVRTRWRAMANHLAQRIAAQKSAPASADVTEAPVPGEPRG
jgi:hypothetical protein